MRNKKITQTSSLFRYAKMTNEEIIWDYLYKKLNNPYGTAGLMGNLFAESSLNPILANNIKKYGMTNQQYTDITDANKNNNFISDGIAYGLVQWRYHTRKQGLLEKARAEKKSVGNIYLQLDYLWEELQKYTTVLSTLYSAKTIREASDVVLVRYEKPATTTEAVRQKRASYGQKYFDKYKGINSAIKKEAAEELIKELERVLK